MDSEVFYILLVESLAKKLLVRKVCIFSVVWGQSFFYLMEKKMKAKNETEAYPLLTWVGASQYPSYAV